MVCSPPGEESGGAQVSLQGLRPVAPLQPTPAARRAGVLLVACLPEEAEGPLAAGAATDRSAVRDRPARGGCGLAREGAGLPQELRRESEEDEARGACASAESAKGCCIRPPSRDGGSRGLSASRVGSAVLERVGEPGGGWRGTGSCTRPARSRCGTWRRFGRQRWTRSGSVSAHPERISTRLA